MPPRAAKASSSSNPPSSFSSSSSSSSTQVKRKRNHVKPAETALLSQQPKGAFATKTAKGKARDASTRPAQKDALELIPESSVEGIQAPDDDDEEEEKSQGERNGGEEDGEEEEDQEEFPEIDTTQSDQEDEEENVDGGQDGDQDVEEEEEEEQDDDDDDDQDIMAELQDEEDGDEEGYNSSDIDNWDSEAEDERAEAFAARDDASDTSIEQELNRMVKRATEKPDESDRKTNLLGIDQRLAARAVADDKNPDGSSKGIFKRSEITGEMKRVYPEIEADYDSDSSTEDAPNRVGNVPMEWYDDLPHIGYDIDGRKIMRPAKGDELDRFLETVDGDGNAWYSAEDKLMGKDTKLTDEELDIIRRLQRAEIPDGEYDPYEPTIEWFTGKGMEMVTPLTGRPEPKRRFVPSKWEHKKIMKIVRAIRQGRIVPRAPNTSKPQFFNIWSDADQERADHPMHMPAPKLPLPGHAESYNPPAEYLFNEEETKEWKEAEPEDRKTNFLPAKYSALRLVPGYQNFVQERFERCLDLYLAPRMRRKRLDLTDPESLIPKLPSPRELRPFPTTTGLIYRHPSEVRVRCLSIDPKGNWLVTGAEDGKVRMWDLAIGRCTATWDINEGIAKSERGPVYGIEWCPNKNYSLFAATTSGRVTLVAPPQCSTTSVTATSTPSFIYATSAYQPAVDSNAAETATTGNKAPVKWTRPTESERKQGVAIHISLHNNSGTPKQISWHSKGDYFSTVCPEATGGSSSVLIHQVTKHRSQAPFKKASKGSSVQKIVFHPTKPHIFVATQRYVRVYDLTAQSLVKTLITGLKWISSIDVHPGGDNIIIGSYDKRLAWFDIDLSNRPYKTMRYHSKAIRSVSYHKSYPLFVSTSDDGTAQVFHGTVYNDFSKNPLIVPLKVLRGHEIRQALGVLDSKWHPNQPWLFTAGADGQVRLWTP
ncbi:BOP1NT-domain-containing protein [Violaceomyces palustris]|uniref:BOP1NT-domain-containing protein n=1 Tax=Violaceomyces palustris TaxID=1673888 RepID=A0ACD0NXB7_9BASI|nr:BOP1NT-domain-containing protein [Violaceomyces palustris]